MILDGDINSTEYKEIKIKLQGEIDLLLIQESKIRQGTENYDKKIDGCLFLLKNTDKFFNSGNAIVKQRIIGSIFPEKMIFENKKYRTLRLNEAALQIFRIGGLFKGNKKGKDCENYNPSLGVEPKDLLSNEFWDDLNRITILIKYLERKSTNKW